ncbi:CPBP family intramembrane metalloprotease [Alloscardovia theropitheci]|uniref:CPBP family intramembrane metalloprotease n=1 Tax=Alloscardovia theropitheci TaxID=2496842 RepID=A0A4R0QPW9_9BIFI|nr:CPBP family intramembrane glutamic endopeptidase [Alloscardovia theropitheci]TCD54312.1 CPBP family intramembrane metalloprotease [Alloscardovia theropitheci]
MNISNRISSWLKTQTFMVPARIHENEELFEYPITDKNKYGVIYAQNYSRTRQGQVRAYVETRFSYLARLVMTIVCTLASIGITWLCIEGFGRIAYIKFDGYTYLAIATAISFFVLAGGYSAFMYFISPIKTFLVSDTFFAKKPYFVYRNIQGSSWLRIILGVVIYFVINVVLNNSLDYIVHTPDTGIDSQQSSNYFRAISLVYGIVQSPTASITRELITIIGMIIIIPVCEEFIYRGVVLPSIMGLMSPNNADEEKYRKATAAPLMWWSIIISTIIFALIHSTTRGASGVGLISGICASIVLGIITGYSRCVSGSIKESVWIHVLCNFGSVIAMYAPLVSYILMRY